MAIRISGLNSGLDTDAIVQELVSAYSLKTQKYEKAQTKISWKQDAWKGLNTKIYGLYTNVSNLRFSSAYNLKKTTVSDNTKATVTASGTAVSGTQKLNILSTAQSGYITGADLSGKANGKNVTGDTTLGALGYNGGNTSIEIRTNDGNVETIDVTKNTKVSDFLKELQGKGYNTNFDEENQRIFISSKKTGKDADFVIAGIDADGNKVLKALGLNVALVKEDGSGFTEAGAIYAKDYAYYKGGTTITSDMIGNTEVINDTKGANTSYTTLKNNLTADTYGMTDSQADKVINILVNTYSAKKDEATNKTALTEALKDSELELTEEQIENLVNDNFTNIEEIGNYLSKYENYSIEEIANFDASTDTMQISDLANTLEYVNKLVDVAAAEKFIAEDNALKAEKESYESQIAGYTYGKLQKAVGSDNIQSLISDLASKVTVTDTGENKSASVDEDAINNIKEVLKNGGVAEDDIEKIVDGAVIIAKTKALDEDVKFKTNTLTEKDVESLQKKVNKIDTTLTRPNRQELLELHQNTIEAAENDIVDGKNFLERNREFLNSSEIAEIVNEGGTRRDVLAKQLAGKALDAQEILTDEDYRAVNAIKVNGSDAEIELNGVKYTSASNNFSINGLSITAQAVTGAGIENAISITTNTDAQGIYDKVKDFLTEYNTLINEMTKLYNAESARDYEPLTDEEKDAMSDEQIEKWETKIKDSLLRRDTTLNGIMSVMINSMAQVYEIGGNKLSLSTFGISTLGFLNAADNENYAYHIDGDPDDENTSGKEDELMKAIEADPEQVMEFMQKLTTSLYSAIDNKMKSTDLSSAYKVYNDKELESQYNEYTSLISKWEEKVADREDYYYKKFSQMESAMANLQSQTNSLSGLLG